GLLVLLVDRLADRGDATPQDLLGDRALLLGEGLEHGGAVRPPRSQSLRLGLGLRSRPGGAGAPLGPRTPLAALALGPTRALAAGPVAVAAGAVAPSATVTVVTSAAPAVAVTALATPLGRQGRRDQLVVTDRCTEDLQPLGLLAPRLGRQDRGDGDALDV